MRGYSLLECICSLCIVALLTASMTQLAHRAGTILSTTATALDQRFSIAKTGLTISAALSALERTHLSGVITTTSGSQPTTPFGTPHPAQGLSGTSRPRADSAILSAIEVEPRYRGRITQSTFSADSITVEVCGAPELPDANTFRSHLAIGLHSTCQITGTPTPTINGCFTLSGKNIQGLIANTCPAHSLLEYIPVLREFSLFIDRTGELRLISHVGTRIIENQPIVRGLRALDITPINAGNNTSIYRIDVHANATRSHRFFIAGALTREAVWNEILL